MRKEIVTSCLAVTKESCNFKKKRKKKRRRRKDEGNTVPLSQPDQETQVKEIGHVGCAQVLDFRAWNKSAHEVEAWFN